MENHYFLHDDDDANGDIDINDDDVEDDDHDDDDHIAGAAGHCRIGAV